MVVNSSQMISYGMQLVYQNKQHSVLQLSHSPNLLEGRVWKFRLLHITVGPQFPAGLSLEIFCYARANRIILGQKLYT